MDDINITDDVYKSFNEESARRYQNSPVREKGKEFWDIFAEKESDVSQNSAVMGFLNNIKTEMPT
jgi:hypothetical protein